MQITNWQALAEKIKQWGIELGFQQVGITDTNLQTAEAHLDEWLERGYAGEMYFMHKHGTKRARPAELVPGTQRIISVRMDYLPPESRTIAILNDANKAFVSRYAVGRDYHKVLKKKLMQLAEKITAEVGSFGYRAYVDSAPVLEKPLAAKAGLGWQGKNTNLINRFAGSYFFLGELYTDLPLPVDESVKNHCGSCKACLNVCPTQAFVAPYVLDARRCISYLTIEFKGIIPLEFRKAMGNRIYGCDDCQLVCPWNRYAKPSSEPDFQPRHGLLDSDLLELFQWSEEEFLQKTEGSAIRRIGYESWLRNIAIALGNAPSSKEITQALQAKLSYPSAIVQEHVLWALKEHGF
ncbi:MAG: queG [Gammaproteobacteria bacterium]|jgi:epoxyqueuosine reductase|nr:queG [Gammaproteobacteria bacterium]